MNERKDVGLLLVDNSELIPTEVGRKTNFKLDADFNFRSFDIGKDVAEVRTSKNTPYKNYYRHFKADLALKKSSLKSPEGKKWEMKTRVTDTDSDRGHGGHGERISDDGSVFNPQMAAYVFLRKLCARAIRRAKQIADTEDGVKVHLTAPAYEDKAKQRSQRYRDHIREVIDQFKDDRAFRGVDFAVNQDDFLYEPYGVYYYYAFLQDCVSPGEEQAGNTYLIYDMGGSTTDVGIVQINRQGEVTTAYPICRSIDCAGAYFDRFILKYLRGDERLKQVSAKWNPEFEKIEEAKISLCEGKEDEVELEIKGERHILTRDKIAEALRELWNDDNRPLAQGFRGFLEQVQSYARKNPLFLEFDNIQKVFLAGGSIGLPGLKDLILETLRTDRFDLIADQTSRDDIFEEPALSSSSSIAALGRAAELANANADLVLSRAERVYAKIVDDGGCSYVFRPIRDRELPDLEKDEDETFLFGVDELESGETDDKKWVKFKENEYQNYNPKKKHNFPEKVDISLRTEISSYPDSPDFSENVDDELRKNASGQDFLRFKFSCFAQYDEDNVRVKPFVFTKYKGLENRRRLFHEQGSERISLTPDPVDAKVHVCIDLGMNNTCVAICTPGDPLPEDVDDLKILLPNAQLDKDPPTDVEVGQDVSGDGAAVPADEPVPANGGGRKETTTTTRSTLELPEGLISQLTDLVEAFKNQQGTETQSLVESFSSIMEEATGHLEEIAEKLDQISTDGTESARSSHPAEPILDAISENKHSYGTPKTEDEDFESFVQFVREHEEGLYYPDSVLRTVWMHTQSDNSRLAILAGPPGSGKSSLVRVVAEFFNRDVGEDWKHYHHLQPVSPTWFSPSSLLGSYSEIDGEYHSTDFLRFMITAEKHFDWMEGDDERSRLFFACLDEFNIAQPEQYMADLLSKMEARRGSKSRSITLCRKDRMGWNKNLTVEISPNLKLFATINTDASTKTLSPKVLDRSIFIRLTPTYDDLTQVATSLAEKYDVQDLHDALLEASGGERDEDDPEPPSLLGDLMMIGRYAETPFGYRVLEQAYEHASHHPRLDRDLDGVLDDIICNFFLPKLPGSHAVSNPMEYVDAISEEKAPRLRKYPNASQILNSIANGLPGQAAV